MKLLFGLSHGKDRLGQQVMLTCTLILLVLLVACGSDTRGVQTTPTSTVARPPIATIAAGPLTGQIQLNINFHHRVNEVYWSPNGHYVAVLVSTMPNTLSPSSSDTLAVVNTQSGKIIREASFAQMQGDISRPSWSPNSTFLAFQVDTSPGTHLATVVEVLNLQSQQSLWQQQLAHNVSTYAMLWSPNSQFLAIDFGSQASPNGLGLGIYAATNGKSLAFNGEMGQQFGIAWSPDSTRVAVTEVSTLSERLVLWNFSTNQTTAITSDKQSATWLAWSPNGKLLEREGLQDIETLNLATGKTLCSLELAAPLASLLWSSDNAHLYATEYDGTAQAWNVITCTPMLSVQGQKDSTNAALPLEWSPNDRYLAAVSTNNTISIYDTTTAMTLLTFAGHTQQITSIDWSPNSTLVASASSDGTVQIWQASKD